MQVLTIDDLGFSHKRRLFMNYLQAKEQLAAKAPGCSTPLASEGYHERPIAGSAGSQRATRNALSANQPLSRIGDVRASIR